ADAVRPVVTDEELFVRSGSAVVLATLAVLVSVVACAGAITVTTIIGAVVPEARVVRVQVTETFPAFEHAQPAPVAVTKVTPAGSVSVTVRLAGSDGPAFATTTW